MRVVLKENVESLGKAGDVLKVADGYARNYLIPKKLAIEASNKSVKALEQEKQLILQKVEREKKKAEILVEQMQGITCTISCRVGEQEKLFGSVTAKDIEQSLAKQGVEVDKKMIILDEPIKSTGDFAVKIRLQPGITAEIKVIVVAENQE